MQQEELTRLSDQELLERRKKAKSAQIITATVLGVFIGVAVYSAVNNGFGFFTFFPLFFVYIIIRNQTNSNALEKEIKARNLK